MLFCGIVPIKCHQVSPGKFKPNISYITQRQSGSPVTYIPCTILWYEWLMSLYSKNHLTLDDEIWNEVFDYMLKVGWWGWRRTKLDKNMEISFALYHLSTLPFCWVKFAHCAGKRIVYNNVSNKCFFWSPLVPSRG